MLGSLGRAIVRILRPFPRARGAMLALFYLLAALGLTTSWDTVSTWLENEWPPWATAALGVGLLLTFIACWGMQIDLDRSAMVRVRKYSFQAQFRPEFGNELARQPKNVLVIEIVMTFVNDTEKPSRGFAPEVEVSKHIGLLRREPIELRYFGAITMLRGQSPWDIGSYYDPLCRFDIPATDEMVKTFAFTAQTDTASVVGKKLDLVLYIKVVGQPKLKFKGTTTVTSYEPFRASSTAPEQSPPS